MIRRRVGLNKAVLPALYFTFREPPTPTPPPPPPCSVFFYLLLAPRLALPHLYLFQWTKFLNLLSFSPSHLCLFQWENVFLKARFLISSRFHLHPFISFNGQCLSFQEQSFKSSLVLTLTPLSLSVDNVFPFLSKLSIPPRFHLHPFISFSGRTSLSKANF